jgi:DNA-binding transcriptional LysR family regulator
MSSYGLGFFVNFSGRTAKVASWDDYKHPIVHATIRPGDLRNEPFVIFARRMGPLAFDRTVARCEAEGFRPNVVQEVPQWPTAIRLVAAGSGVSLAPACVANFAMPGVVYKKVRSQHWTSIDIGLKPNLDNPAVEALLSIVRAQFSKKSSGSAARRKAE